MGLFNFSKNQPSETATRSFRVNEIEIKITVKRDPTRHNWVISGIFREPIQSINFIHYTAEEDFFQEISTIVNGLRNLPLTTENLIKSLMNFCTEQLKQYGRLIDVDIEAYIDDALHVIVGILDATGNQPLPHQIGCELREQLKTIIYKNFYEYIWVNTGSPSTGSQLVKLSDLR